MLPFQKFWIAHRINCPSTETKGQPLFIITFGSNFWIRVLCGNLILMHTEKKALEVSKWTWCNVSFKLVICRRAFASKLTPIVFVIINGSPKSFGSHFSSTMDILSVPFAIYLVEKLTFTVVTGSVNVSSFGFVYRLYCRFLLCKIRFDCADSSITDSENSVQNTF